MPRGRKSKGARLYFREGKGLWYIRDGSIQRSTGCIREDREGAERQLAEYITARHSPTFGRGRPDEVSVASVLILYTQERAMETRRPDVIYSAGRALLGFWGDKTVEHVRPGECARYVAWRTKQPQARYKVATTAPRVGDQTARRELEVLSAAISYAHKEGKLLYPVPVKLPAKAAARDRWLTRSEAARLVWAAWRAPQGKSRHVARFVLLALYTGTRLDACLKLRWMPSTGAGWVDLDKAIIYRKGSTEKQSSKRRTPVPISDRLIAHLRRWRRLSTTHVIEYAGRPTLSVKRSFRSARESAGLDAKVVPHVLRHTFATWAVQSGQPTGMVAAALGTTERIVSEVYGHHAPDRLRGVVNAVGKRQ
jgi:integrase